MPSIRESLAAIQDTFTKTGDIFSARVAATQLLHSVAKNAEEDGDLEFKIAKNRIARIHKEHGGTLQTHGGTDAENIVFTQYGGNLSGVNEIQKVEEYLRSLK